MACCTLLVKMEPLDGGCRLGTCASPVLTTDVVLCNATSRSIHGAATPASTFGKMSGTVDAKSGKRSRMVEVNDGTIGSSKNLWVLISGASAITAKELVGTELQKNLKKISNGLNFYLVPSSSSSKKLHSDIKVDAKVQSFILQLAKFMNLDEVQCYGLFCDFLLYDYRGSETSLQNAVSNERFMQNLMLQIWDYYRCERLYLLLCIKEILAHFNDLQHPYHDLFDEFLALVDQNNALRTSLLSQWEMLIKVVIPSSKRPSYLIDTHSKTLLWFTLREQCELLQALLIYFNDKPGDAGMFLSLLKSFREHGFGWQQLHTYRFDVNPASQDILQSIGYLESLILLQTLNLHTLDNSPDGNPEFFLYKNKSVWQEVDTIMCRLASQREPLGKLVSLLCLAWAVARFYVLSDDSSNHGVTRGLGESALQFGVFDFLHTMMLNRTFQGDGPIQYIARSIISWLLSALLSKFDDSTLGNTQALYMVAGELVKDPKVSERFWEQGLESSLGMLLATSMSYFPHCFCTLVDLLSGLAESSPASASKVFDCFNQLSNFTSSLLPDMDVEELSTDEQILRLAQDFKTDTIRLASGTVGYSVPSKFQGQYDVVQWQQDISGWEISLLMMKAIVGCEQVTPGQIRNVASLARLLRSVLVNQPNAYLELDQLVDQLFLVIQRFAKLTNPPADVIASALNLASAVSGDARLLRMWQRLVHVGFLPMNPSIAYSYQNNVEFSHGTINSIISSCECVTGEYPVTLAFLNLISTFVPVLIDRDDPHFSACVAFVVREIFPAHSRFWYRSAEQKEEMAQKCLNVIHLILRVPSANSITNTGSLNKGSLQSVVLQCLLHQEAGHSLLQVICQLSIQPTRADGTERTGAEEEEVAHHALEQQIGWVSGHGLQPFKLALSVLNRLLILWSREALQQPSVLISSLCSNPHAIRTVANYIYQSDTRLATLAVLLMRRFAKELPISLLVCLGPDASTFCKLLLFRLEARAEDIHLKAAILTFMSACVESQPGTTEVFIGDLNHEKPNSKENPAPGSCASHCLKLVVDILRRSKEDSSGRLEELRVGALSFLRSLWIGRQTIALSDLRKCSDLWNILLEPLIADDSLASHQQSSALTLGLLAQEFILKPSKGDDNGQLLGLLAKVSDSALLKWMDDVYEKYAVRGNSSLDETSLLADSVADSPEGLLKAWNDFLTVGLKTNLLTVTSARKGIIVHVTIKALNDELGRECHRAHIKVLSETLLHLLRLWHGTDLNSNEIMEATGRLLNSVMAAGANIPSKVLANIVASFIEVVPNSSESGLDPRTTNSWMGVMCDVIHQSVLVAEKAIEQGGPNAAAKTQLVVLCVSLLQKISRVCSDADLLLVHLQRSAALHTLLHFTQTCLRRGAPEGCHDVLQLFRCLSNHPQVARSILEAEVVQTLCLPLAELRLLHAGDCTDPSQMKWWDVYRSALHLLTCLLHNLRHYVVEPTFLDFVRVHLTIFMTIPGQLQRNLTSESLEMALSVLYLMEELSHFRSLQLHSISPRREIVAITASICSISIAYLLRPRLILHSMGIRDSEADKDISTSRKLSTADFDQKNPKQTDAMTKLLRIASMCTSILCNFSPDLLELLSSKGYDTEHWEQLLTFGFTTPSLDQITEANFGMVISSVIVCLKLLGLGDHTLSPVPVTSAPENAFPDRKLVTTFLEKSLYLILSQAILLNSNQPVWDKQLFKRELGAELGQFVHSRHLRRVPGASSPLYSPASSAPSVSPVQTRARMPFEKSPFLTLVSTLVENLFK